MSSTLRTLRRSIVRGRMKNAGIRKINKGHYFSENWRDPKWNHGFVKQKG